MAVTSDWPTLPEHGPRLASLVGLSPKAATMAFISSGMGARTTTCRLPGPLAMAHSLPLF
jgi:hypothetical protein